ncbi:MAG TPA: hypothetical protein VLA39_07460 [Marinobacterium sp.]|nr:hypothetical protein [Marinobacterium sp.]
MKRLLDKQITPRQLLSTHWSYEGSELINSDQGAECSYHRVVTHWFSDSGETLSMQLNFVCADRQDERIVVPSSHVEPRLSEEIALVDEYGFAVRRSQKRALEWDLLMCLDIDSVSQDLQHRLLAH